MSEGIPTYKWRMAPRHLFTRRQLAEAGLRPNGQDIAGKLPLHGKFAYLYDIGKAAPKRPATEAQLAALAKATREHQLRAAERRGFDRSEFEQTPEHDGIHERTAETASHWDSAPAGAPDVSSGNALADAISRNAERDGMDR